MKCQQRFIKGNKFITEKGRAYQRHTHQHTRDMTNYQERENIWEPYFQLAREEVQVQEKTKQTWEAFLLTQSASVADLESRNGRRYGNQRSDKGQYRNSWARSPLHSPLLHTKTWNQECLHWKESRDEFPEETVSSPGEC